VVVSGTAEVELDGETRLLRKGESTFVHSGMKHRLRNPGVIPLEVIEVQLGEYLEEDDILRFEDDYGRD
jgi:mannose-1-phosphate guanylyltransferase/mannose-6-phosphate isomerase